MTIFRFPPTKTPIAIPGQRFALFNLTSEVSVNIFFRSQQQQQQEQDQDQNSIRKLQLRVLDSGNSCYLAK